LNFSQINLLKITASFLTEVFMEKRFTTILLFYTGTK